MFQSRLSSVTSAFKAKGAMITGRLHGIRSSIVSSVFKYSGSGAMTKNRPLVGTASTKSRLTCSNDNWSSCWNCYRWHCNKFIQFCIMWKRE